MLLFELSLYTELDVACLLIFYEYDKQGNLIGGQPVRVYVTQTSGSVDWTEVKNDVSVVLPDTAFKLIVKLVGGARMRLVRFGVKILLP